MSEAFPDEFYTSVLAPWMIAFVREKRGLGCRYVSEAGLLRQLDRQAVQTGLTVVELSRSLVERWIEPEPHHQPKTLELRRHVARQFAKFLVRNELPAYILPERVGKLPETAYAPYIFTRSEIARLFAAVDALPVSRDAPRRHRVTQEVIRLLYGCGLRINEALSLMRADVDLEQGVLRIREAKGDRERLVPVAESIRIRLLRYTGEVLSSEPETPFFPNRQGGCYQPNTFYSMFRHLLFSIGISHGGRGKGPRVHDLRHTFAVHRLNDWYREGADVAAKLPILATYLGHKHMTGTQHYLHLTAEIFPDLMRTIEGATASIIPPPKEELPCPPPISHTISPGS